MRFSLNKTFQLNARILLYASFHSHKTRNITIPFCQKPQNASERKNVYKLPVGYDKFVELGVGTQKEEKGEDDE